MKLARFASVLLVTVALGGAVYGAAASFTVSGPGLGAGDTVVVACDTAILVSFGEVAWEPAIEAYEITTVTVTGIDQSLSPPPSCKDAHFRLQLAKTDGAALGLERDIPSIDGATLLGWDFSDENIKAADVADVHIAIYGP